VPNGWPPKTKSDVAEKVANETGLSKRDAARAVDAILESITDALKGGDSVTFTGFGKFSAQQRSARTGVNPRTGERVQIPAATVPKFSASDALKRVVRD
jgi:DNA-binding protein HU-beta